MKYRITVGVLSLCLGTLAWAAAPSNDDNNSADTELQREPRQSNT